MSGDCVSGDEENDPNFIKILILIPSYVFVHSVEIKTTQTKID